MPMNIRESVAAALVFEGESFMVYSKEMHNGGVEIVDVNGVLYNVVAQVIRFTVCEAWFYATASHPHSETSWVMISAVIGLG